MDDVTSVPDVPDVPDVLDALDAGLLELVQSAPHGSPAQLARAAEHAFELALHAAASRRTELLGLACAMERCLELIAEGRVDPGVALPALAMAAHTARSPSLPAVNAARYELETLLPVPGQPAAARRTLDVPAASLVRRPAAPTRRQDQGQDREQDREQDRIDSLAASWPEPVRRAVTAARQRLRSD